MSVRRFIALVAAVPVLACATSASAQQLPYEDPAEPDAEVIYDGEVVVAPPPVPPLAAPAMAPAPPLPPLPPLPQGSPVMHSAHPAHPGLMSAPPVYAAAPPTMYVPGPGYAYPNSHPHPGEGVHPFPGQGYLPYGNGYASVAYVPVLVAVPQRAVVRETVTEEWVPGPAPARSHAERQVEYAPAPDKRIKLRGGR
ncbi:hypothetical protein ACWPM1_01495 [Tsuneonella sp. HG249]